MKTSIETSATYTLELITQRRIEKKEEINQSKACICNLTKQLVAPQKSKSKIEYLMQNINSGIAAYDGIMTGLKILKRIRKYFAQKK
jgi:hypothetical protein